MTEHTTQLPQHVQQALDTHQEAKAAYLTARERLATLSQRIAKHRKAASAAASEAVDTGRAWREGFRQNDGELTKALRGLKTKEIEARDAAAELATLADELQPKLLRGQIETAHLRRQYRGARDQAARQYLDHALEEATERLFAQPAAAAFFDALDRRLALVAIDAAEDPVLRAVHTPQTAEGREAIHTAAVSRQQHLLSELVASQKLTAGAAPEGAPDPVWEALEPMPASDPEGGAQFDSPAFLNQARFRLRELTGGTESAGTP